MRIVVSLFSSTGFSYSLQQTSIVQNDSFFLKVEYGRRGSLSFLIVGKH